jgi:hypothetical protein
MHGVCLLAFFVKKFCNGGDDLKSMALIVIPAKRSASRNPARSGGNDLLHPKKTPGFPHSRE